MGITPVDSNSVLESGMDQFKGSRHGSRMSSTPAKSELRPSVERNRAISTGEASLLSKR